MKIMLGLHFTVAGHFQPSPLGTEMLKCPKLFAKFLPHILSMVTGDKQLIPSYDLICHSGQKS